MGPLEARQAQSVLGDTQRLEPALDTARPVLEIYVEHIPLLAWDRAQGLSA